MCGGVIRHLDRLGAGAILRYVAAFGVRTVGDRKRPRCLCSRAAGAREFGRERLLLRAALYGMRVSCCFSLCRRTGRTSLCFRTFRLLF